ARPAGAVAPPPSRLLGAVETIPGPERVGVGIDEPGHEHAPTRVDARRLVVVRRARHGRDTVALDADGGSGQGGAPVARHDSRVLDPEAHRGRSPKPAMKLRKSRAATRAVRPPSS